MFHVTPDNKVRIEGCMQTLGILPELSAAFIEAVVQLPPNLVEARSRECCQICYKRLLFIQPQLNLSLVAVWVRDMLCKLLLILNQLYADIYPNSLHQIRFEHSTVQRLAYPRLICNAYYSNIRTFSCIVCFSTLFYNLLALHHIAPYLSTERIDDLYALFLKFSSQNAMSSKLSKHRL